MLHVCRPHCYLEAAGAALRLSARWSALRMEERSVFLTVVQKEVEDESRLHRAGFPFLPVYYFLWFVTGASQNASIPEAAQIIVN